jgi:hypothetical protein
MFVRIPFRVDGPVHFVKVGSTIPVDLHPTAGRNSPQRRIYLAFVTYFSLCEVEYDRLVFFRFGILPGKRGYP